MKKVSVIVPVYNIEKHLEKCLNSLVNQTLQEIEIIVVNDGSTDNSQEIITNFQAQFPSKISSYIKDNGGLSDARNFGIDRATGQYIGFVDSDDFVSENMFQEMYDLAQKDRSEMVICNLQKVDEAGRIIQHLPQIPTMPGKIFLRDNFSVFADLSYFACNKIFKRELFKQKRFKPGIHFEDIHLIPQLLLECTVVSQTQKYHYQYLQRENSITRTHTLRGLDMLSAVTEVENAFKKSKYAENKKELKNFQILQGVYSFLAYLAFVKEDEDFKKMSAALRKFCKNNSITLREILLYKRFGKNYLLYLPLKKKIYYLLYFFGQERLLRKLIKNTSS